MRKQELVLVKVMKYRTYTKVFGDQFSPDAKIKADKSKFLVTKVWTQCLLIWTSYWSIPELSTPQEKSEYTKDMYDCGTLSLWLFSWKFSLYFNAQK